MNDIDKFLSELISEGGRVFLTVEEKTRAIAKLKEELLVYINDAAVAALSEDQAKELARLAESDSFTDEQASDFLAKSGVNLEAVTEKAVEEFRTSYLNKAKA